jgi:[acyl-carrier-protein] S-malonyltransferase
VTAGLALLFPCQGAQRPGMGAALSQTDADLLGAHLRRAADSSGLPIDRYCAEGPADVLVRTEVAQPALFAVSLALADVARAIGLRPRAFAGHSLGEYSAAVAAGALAPGDGAALVADRGRLMARAQLERPGAMAAVLGPPAEAVETLCSRAAGADTLTPANFNAPTQTVVSGDDAAVERLLAAVRRLDGARGIRLPVGAAFHSPLMRPVQERVAAAAAALDWREPAAPLASNADGRLVRGGPAVRDALVAQIAAPVRWVACVRALVESGCRHFLQLGPGGVLPSLVRQIAPAADVAAADSRAAIEAFAAERPHLLAA